MPPATKAINAYRSILQELERALKQIDDSAKIAHYALTLEKYPEVCVTSPDISIKDPAFITKLL